jgi:hypothetical protein
MRFVSENSETHSDKFKSEESGSQACKKLNAVFCV